MRGFVFTVFFPLFLFAEQKYQASDIPQAISCLKHMAELRYTHVNYQISGDGIIAIRSIKKRSSPQDPGPDDFYLFEPSGRASFCAKAKHNTPPKLQLDRVFTAEERRESMVNCTTGDHNVGVLMEQIKQMLPKLSQAYKLAVKTLKDSRKSIDNAKFQGNAQEQKNQKNASLRRLRNSVSPEQYAMSLSICGKINDKELANLVNEQDKMLRQATQKNPAPNTDDPALQGIGQ